MQNNFLLNECTLEALQDNASNYPQFDCGNQDINDFFRNDALKYQNELLGKTYFFP